MTNVGHMLLWFVLSLATAELPAFTAGTELRVVSPDLLTVYSSGRVQDDLLTIDLPLDPGVEVRLLVFAPDASDEEVAVALSMGAAIYARVALDQADLLIHVSDRVEPLSLREWLADEHAIELVMSTRRVR